MTLPNAQLSEVNPDRIGQAEQMQDLSEIQNAIEALPLEAQARLAAWMA